jgi:hypothetical protein
MQKILENTFQSFSSVNFSKIYTKNKFGKCFANFFGAREVKKKHEGEKKNCRHVVLLWVFFLSICLGFLILHNMKIKGFTFATLL